MNLALDVPLGEGIEPSDDHYVDGFMYVGNYTMYAFLRADGTTLKAGDFEATATFNASYY